MSLTTFPKNGNVVGPVSATDGHLAVFDGTTGQLIKDGGAVPGDISGLTTNTVTKATSATTIGDSQITDDGTAINVGSLSTTATLNLNVTGGGTGTFGNAGGGAATLEVNSGSGTTTIGDVNGAGNGTTLTVLDGDGEIDVSTGVLNTANVVPTVDLLGVVNIGLVARPYASLFIGAAANTTTQQSSAATANRTATWPDASGTVQLVGAANTGCVLTCLSNNTVLSTATGQVFTSPGNDGTPLTVTSEGAVGWVVTRPGTIRNLYIRTGTTNKVNTPATAIVVRKNGADTALTVAALTQTATTTSSDVTHSFAVVAGDVITVSLTTTGVAGVSVSIASITFELD